MTLQGKLERYALGKPFEDIYFTSREAQCMTLLLKGNSYRQIGAILSLSARAIESYILNMKVKLKCRTISELIAKVKQSEFVNQLSHVEQTLPKTDKF